MAVTAQKDFLRAGVALVAETTPEVVVAAVILLMEQVHGFHSLLK